MWVCVVLVLCVACVALYACGVRRFYGLLRVCLPFVLLPFSFCLSPFAFRFISLLLLFVLLSFFALVVFCLSSCLVLFVLVVFVVVSFSLAVCTQKERARRVGASSLVLLCLPFQIYLMSLAKSKIILPFAVS